MTRHEYSLLALCDQVRGSLTGAGEPMDAAAMTFCARAG